MGVSTAEPVVGEKEFVGIRVRVTGMGEYAVEKFTALEVLGVPVRCPHCGKIMKLNYKTGVVEVEKPES